MHCYRWRVCGWNTWRVSDRYEWTVSSEYAPDTPAAHPAGQGAHPASRLGAAYLKVSLNALKPAVLAWRIRSIARNQTLRAGLLLCITVPAISEV